MTFESLVDQKFVRLADGTVRAYEKGELPPRSMLLALQRGHRYQLDREIVTGLLSAGAEIIVTLGEQ